jgi:DNA-binding transcriptional ArsR family regulator
MNGSLINFGSDMTSTSDTSGDLDLRRLRAIYRALGDETRLRIIALLAERGPLPVNEVSTGIGLSQPLISWHLRIMRLAGVVETRRQGREAICRLRLAAFDELHEAEARLVAGTSNVTQPAAGSGSGEEVPNVG